MYIIMQIHHVAGKRTCPQARNMGYALSYANPMRDAGALSAYNGGHALLLASSPAASKMADTADMPPGKGPAPLARGLPSPSAHYRGT